LIRENIFLQTLSEVRNAIYFSQMMKERYNRGFQKVSDRENEIERHRQYAEAALKKNRRVNIRISDYDFNALRKYALKEGIRRRMSEMRRKSIYA